MASELEELREQCAKRALGYCQRVQQLGGDLGELNPNGLADWISTTPLPLPPLATQWVSVKERLPDNYTTVLLACSNEMFSTGYRTNLGKWMIDADDPSDGANWIPTHWSLPQPPKEQK